MCVEGEGGELDGPSSATGGLRERLKKSTRAGSTLTVLHVFLSLKEEDKMRTALTTT